MWSKGISWIDDCRIPFVDETDMMKPTLATRDEFNDYKKAEGRKNIRQGGGFVKQSNIQGRFPANILVCDDMLNDGSIGGSSYCPPTKYKYETSSDKFNNGAIRTKTGIGDKGSNSRYYDIDKWFEKILNYE